MAQIYARPLPPVERMQEVQRLVRDPKETPTDTIKAAQLIKQARPPVAYTPRSLSQAASQAQLPVTPRPAPRPDPRLVPQPRVPANVPPPISPEDEAILMAQAGGRASIPQQVQNLASRGRHGDTMLMHVNPQEFQGLSTLLGPTTTNPDTGLPEAFAWWIPLVGAAIGGVGAAATGHDWKKGALLGGLAGLGAGFAFPGMAGAGAAGSAVAPLAGSAGASTLVPAIGTTTLSGAAAPMGFYATGMGAAGTGALQSAIPGIAAAGSAASQQALTGAQLLAQGGARNVPTSWFKRNLAQPISNFVNYSGKEQGAIPYKNLVNDKGQSLFSRASDVASGVQKSPTDSSSL